MTTDRSDAARPRLVRALSEFSDLPVVWHGPLLEYTGYADEVRSFVTGLDGRWPLQAVPMGPGDQSFLDRLDDEARQQIVSAVSAQVPWHGVHVIHAPAHGVEPVLGAARTIARTMFETDGLPATWVRHLNRVDEVWVPSEFNVGTFRRAGVQTPIHVMPGGIDPTFFRPDAPPLPIEGVSGTTFLSVFEWSFRKGWDVLLRAWARAFSAGDDVTLVIRSHPVKAEKSAASQDDIERLLNGFLRKIGTSRKRVAPIVLVKDRVAPADMPSLYTAADAYVSTSRGEGWGRPLLEAMACGRPVIATRWSGNLQFMDDENSFLVGIEGLDPIDDREEFAFYRGQRWARPSVVGFAEAMQQVAADRDAAAALGERARHDAETRWSWDAAIDHVVDRLEELRDEICTAPSRPERPAVRWVGDQFSNHSLAHVNREVCSRLVEGQAVDLEVFSREPRGNGAFSVPELDARTGPVLDRPASVEVRHQWPPDWTAPEEGAWVVVQPWEFGGLPDQWVGPLRDEVDEVWCYTEHVRACYEASGVPPELLRVIPLGVDTTRFTPDGPSYPLRTSAGSKLLFVGGTIARKGIDVLLDAYLGAFGPDDDVCLVIKSTGAASFYRNSAQDARIRELADDPQSPAIELVDGELTADEMAALYRACDVLVHPYRGEGFGLPIAEAMASGLPVVVTGHGACLDFCDDANAYLLPAEVTPIPDVDGQPSAAGYWWAEPDRSALAQVLRAVASDPAAAAAKGVAGRERAVRDLSWDATAAAISDRLTALAAVTPRREAPADPWSLDVGSRVSFLCDTDWHSEDLDEAVCSYVSVFGPDDETSLVVPVPPGVDEGEISTRLASALLVAGADPDAMADVLVVPGVTDEARHRLRSLVDVVVLPQDTVDGRPTVVELETSAWQSALDVARRPSPVGA